MAFYTHDGVRHNTQEEAVDYIQQNFVSDVPPFKDALFLALHEHNWGRFDLQAVPTEGDDDYVYLELWETLSSNGEFAGSNVLKYADLTADDSTDKMITYLEKESKFLSMASNEIKEALLDMSSSDLYFYEEEAPVIHVSYVVDGGGYGGEEKSIQYEIDGIFSGEVEFYNSVDNLERLLDDVRSHFVIEAEGEFNPNGGYVGKFRLDHILDSALKTQRPLIVRLGDTLKA